MMRLLPLNTPVISDGKIQLRTKVKKVSITNEQVNKILDQILNLLKEPYNANEELLIDIPCKVNGKSNSSYQLEFAIAPNENLVISIKRKGGSLADINPYMLIKINENTFTAREKNMIKDFIEKGISSLLLEDECREAIKMSSLYRTD